LFLAVFHAHMDFYRKIGPMLRKRSAEVTEIQGLGAVRNAVGWYRRSILVDYFLRGRQTFDALPHEAFVKD